MNGKLNKKHSLNGQLNGSDNMKLLIMTTCGQAVIKDTEILPRLGDKIGMFYSSPSPTVISVCLFPDFDMLKDITEDSIDAIITIE